ncbi:BA3454 family stress response protein [Oceanobacillus sp. CF4.6]
MIQVNITIDYDGKFYTTNVITSRDTSDEEVRKLAASQIEKQWKD